MEVKNVFVTNNITGHTEILPQFFEDESYPEGIQDGTLPTVPIGIDTQAVMSESEEMNRMWNNPGDYTKEELQAAMDRNQELIQQHTLYGNQYYVFATVEITNNSKQAQDLLIGNLGVIYQLSALL